MSRRCVGPLFTAPSPGLRCASLPGSLEQQNTNSQACTPAGLPQSPTCRVPSRSNSPCRPAFLFSATTRAACQPRLTSPPNHLHSAPPPPPPPAPLQLLCAQYAYLQCCQSVQKPLPPSVPVLCCNTCSALIRKRSGCVCCGQPCV